MKDFINRIKNIWSIEELRSRILVTLGMILIYRVGSYVVLPGINPTELDSLTAQGQDGLLGLINAFAGGAFSRASVFALGIMPYISASIAIQLLTLAIPYFQKLQKEGESGRRQMNQITRYLTVVITGFQAFAYIANLKATAASAIVISPTLFAISTVVVLTAGTLFVMWLGERITEKGIGNGISLLIMIGIIARLPGAMLAEFGARMEGAGGPIVFILEIAFLVVIVMLTILLVQGTRRIPVQYAKRVVGNRQFGGVRQYIPLKVNASGVMPIIFAQALMFIPPLIGSAIPSLDDSSWFIRTFSDYQSVGYNLFYALLVVVFTYFYTALMVHPVNMAEEMKKNGGFIPGIKPGRRTAEFIDSILTRITLPGSFFLAVVAILPAIAGGFFNVNSQFAIFFGGTSLLILVAVVLDTLQQIESHLLMRHYDGLMKSGKIKGRSSQPAVGASV